MIRRTLLGILAGLGIGCRRKAKAGSHEALLEEVRELIRKDARTPGLPPTGRYIPSNLLNGSFTLKGGVWIDDRLFYEALGVAVGEAPAGNDVKDLHPGIPDAIFGQCERCARSWKWVHGHSTPCEETEKGGWGFSPLCEKCWSELTPEQRLPFYRSAFLRNVGMGEDPSKWPLVEAAVLKGR